jgi:hypothetical protein
MVDYLIGQLQKSTPFQAFWEILKKENLSFELSNLELRPSYVNLIDLLDPQRPRVSFFFVKK